jgi:hypothetical protein
MRVAESSAAEQGSALEKVALGSCRSGVSESGTPRYGNISLQDEVRRVILIVAASAASLGGR